jgi:hypothetical protein
MNGLDVAHPRKMNERCVLSLLFTGRLAASNFWDVRWWVGRNRQAQTSPDAVASRGLDKAALVLIPIAAVLAALIAAGAAVASGHATAFDELATQQSVEREQLLLGDRGQVQQDLQLLPSYEEHLKAAHLLAKESDERRSLPRVANSLATRSKAELDLARTLRPLFVVDPGPGSDNGTVTYKRGEALRLILAFDEEFQDIQPAVTRALGEDRHRKTLDLWLVVVLLAGALFLFSLSRFSLAQTWRRAHAVLFFVGCLSGAAALLAADAIHQFGFRF